VDELLTPASGRDDRVSGTVGAVTTDVSGNGYEVTVTKSDGSEVEVHLIGSFALDDHGRPGRLRAQAGGMPTTTPVRVFAADRPRARTISGWSWIPWAARVGAGARVRPR
jgi:hypothetical protein